MVSVALHIPSIVGSTKPQLGGIVLVPAVLEAGGEALAKPQPVGRCVPTSLCASAARSLSNH